MKHGLPAGECYINAACAYCRVYPNPNPKPEPTPNPQLLGDVLTCNELGQRRGGGL